MRRRTPSTDEAGGRLDERPSMRTEVIADGVTASRVRSRSTTGDSARAPARPAPPSTRLRLLGWYMALLALALAIGLLLQRSLLLAQLDDEVNAQLRQEVEELEQLSTGRNPTTGQPFGGDVRAIFDTFLRRNIPVEGEALFTLVDGRPYASAGAPVPLLEDPAVVAAWAGIAAPTQAELETGGGRVRYRAVPVLAEGGPRGVFVVAIFLQPKRADVNEVLQTGGVAYGSIFVVASIGAWFAAGRVLRPVRLLTEAARAIKEDDWSRRIPVSEEDEIGQLTRTFNDMLDRLEAAFVTQRRFIDDAGHELRTPITIIRGHLEVMGDDPGERREVRGLVLDELGRMSRLVDDLLLLARAEHPDFLKLHPIDVREFTEEIAAKAAALAADRDWSTAETAPVVMVADRQRLIQALMNLARNAVEHTSGGARIRLGSRSSGEAVRFWVRVEGEGIPPAEHQRIFERFARGRTGRRNADGAGFGLAIVKTIAEAHGGSVELESARGLGSTFTLTLPAAGPEDGREPNPHRRG